MDIKIPKDLKDLKIPTDLKNLKLPKDMLPKGIKPPKKLGGLLRSRVGKGIIAAIVVIVILFIGNSVYNFYHASLGETAFAEKRYDDALEHLSSYYKSNPSDYDRALILVQIYLFTGKSQKATELLEELRASSDSDIGETAKFIFYRGLIDITNNNAQDISAKAVHALSIDPAYVPAQYLLAASQIFAEQNYSRGKQEAQKLVSILDNESEIHAENINLARRLFLKNMPVNTKITITSPFGETEKGSAVDMPTSQYDNFYYLPIGADVQDNLSVNDNAIWLQGLADILLETPDPTVIDNMDNPESLSALYLRAYLFVLDKTYNAAAVHFRQILAFYGDLKGVAQFMLSNASWAGGFGAEPTDNITVPLTQAILADPENFAAFNNLGYLYLHLNDLRDARDNFTKGLALQPLNINLNLNLALLEIANSKFIRAEENLLKFRAAVPQMTDVDIERFNTLLFISYLGQHKTEDAVSLLEGQKTLNENIAINAYLKIANLYFGRGEVSKGIAELIQGLGQIPDSVDILAELLIQYSKEKNVKEYLRIKSRLEDLNAPEDDYRIMLADSLIASPDSRAERIFNEVVRQPLSIAEKAKIIVYRTRELMRQEKGQQALDDIKKNWEADDEPTIELQAILYRLGAEHTDFTNDAARVDMLNEVEKFIDKNPALAIVSQVDVAWALLNLGNPQRVIHQINALGDARFDSPLAIQVLSRAHGAAGDAETAEVVKKRLDTRIGASAGKKKDGDLPVITGDKDLTSRLNNAIKINDYESAVAIYTEILNDDVPRKKPELTYQNRGVAYLVLERYPEAVEDFRKALEYDTLSDESRGLILYNYGYVLAKIQRYGASVDLLNKKLLLQPDDLKTYSLLSQVLIQIKEYPEAADVLKKLIASHPEQIPAYLQLAKIILAINREDITGATGVLNDALKRDPLNLVVHRALADLYTSAGDKANADKHFEIIRNN